MLKFPFEVVERKNTGHTVDVTVTVKLPDDKPTTPASVLAYVRSYILKTDLVTNWVQKNYPNYGISLQGGPRPIMDTVTKPGVIGEVNGRREGNLLGYEQDFRLSRGN